MFFFENEIPTVLNGNLVQPQEFIANEIETFHEKRNCLVHTPEAFEGILKNMHYHTVIFGLPMDSLK